MFDTLMRKFVKWLDPKLERFRPKKPTPKPTKYTPKSLEDFIDIISRTPREILSSKDRDRIAAIMSFDARTVEELMIPKSKMVFVNAKDTPFELNKTGERQREKSPDRLPGIQHTKTLRAVQVPLQNHITYLLQSFRSVGNVHFRSSPVPGSHLLEQ